MIQALRVPAPFPRLAGRSRGIPAGIHSCTNGTLRQAVRLRPKKGAWRVAVTVVLARVLREPGGRPPRHTSEWKAPTTTFT